VGDRSLPKHDSCKSMVKEGASPNTKSKSRSTLYCQRNPKVRLDQARLDQARLDQARLDQARLDQARLDQARLDQATLD
jgi:uncharacterized protein YjbI with pentapeptide repeats